MIWDPIRSLWVAATPEERVRQQWIRYMVDELGYASSAMAVEKEVRSLAPLDSSIDPRRRVDLVYFAPIKGEFKPLLLVECKAGALGTPAASQAFGYNHLIRAPFVCLVNANEAQTVWYEKGNTARVPFLPPCAQLLAAVLT